MSTFGSIRRWIALWVWIAVIFIFSTDSFSSDGSSRFIVPALRFLFPFLSESQLEAGHIVCRKAGHVMEYFVLGILAWRAIISVRSASSRPELWTVILVLAVALTDEFHQAFVPSRSAALADVGYDLIGGMAALLLMLRLRNESGTLHPHSVL